MNLIFKSAVLLFISLQCFGQMKGDSFFNIKSQIPPANWMELIQNGDRWVLYKVVYVRGKRVVKIVPPGPSAPTLKYSSSELFLFPKKQIDSPIVKEVTYFPDQHTYATKETIPSGNEGTLFFYSGEKVVDLKNNFLSIELIDQDKYDYRTGEIISSKEYKKRFYVKPASPRIFGGRAIYIHFGKPRRYILVYSMR